MSTLSSVGYMARYHGKDDRFRGLELLVLAENTASGQIKVQRHQHPPEWVSDANWAVHCAPGAVVPQVPKGGKDDAGKPNPALLFEGCAPALAAVCKVLDGGAKKYAANSWQQVPNGIERYKSAFYRHLQDMQINGWDSVNMEDFGLLHIDHLITDLLFIRTLMHKEANVPV